MAVEEDSEDEVGCETPQTPQQQPKSLGTTFRNPLRRNRRGDDESPESPLARFILDNFAQLLRGDAQIWYTAQLEEHDKLLMADSLDYALNKVVTRLQPDVSDALRILRDSRYDKAAIQRGRQLHLGRRLCSSLETLPRPLRFLIWHRTLSIIS